MRHRWATWLILILAIMQTGTARGHGGVVADEDVCIIEIGVFRAHFTIYQPETRGNKEYCEDVPDVSNAVFVLDYLHDSLRQVPVDFRIIRDVNERTIYASWEDVLQIEDIESVTEYYQRARVYPDASMSVEHVFEEEGWYIGIVTAPHPTLDKEYQAVFGFHVGGRGLGYWPLMILVILAVQAHYWISSGGLRRSRRRKGESA